MSISDKNNCKKMKISDNKHFNLQLIMCSLTLEFFNYMKK